MILKRLCGLLLNIWRTGLVLGSCKKSWADFFPSKTVRSLSFGINLKAFEHTELFIYQPVTAPKTQQVHIIKSFVAQVQIQ